MDWKPFGRDYLVAGVPQEVRSLRIYDDLGNPRRCRVSTARDLSKPKFTKTPAVGRLVKDKNGKIGAVVTGKNAGYLKVGKFPVCHPVIFVSLDSLSKKPRLNLLKDTRFEFFNEGNSLFAREPE